MALVIRTGATIAGTHAAIAMTVTGQASMQRVRPGNHR